MEEPAACPLPDAGARRGGGQAAERPAMDAAIDRILGRARRIAVIGASARPERDSHQILAYLLEQGFEVFPVNPREAEILGMRCYPDFASIPGRIDIVDIFRRSEAAGAHVDEAIEAGAGAVWMQLGVVDEEAAGRARDAGMDVVMDRCILVEHRRRSAEAAGG